MALQGEAKKLYHREYMRRLRAGLPTRGVVKPKVMEEWCSECVLPPSPERIVVSLASGYRLCQSCYEAAGVCSPRSSPCVKMCVRPPTTGEANGALRTPSAGECWARPR
jgi:hypothetical protein